jgi:hypothetical protein
VDLTPARMELARRWGLWVGVWLAVFVYVRGSLTDPNVLEVLFVGAGLVGVAAIFWPAALILGAVLGVVACERSSQRRAEGSVTDRRLRTVA